MEQWTPVAAPTLIPTGPRLTQKIPIDRSYTISAADVVACMIRPELFNRSSRNPDRKNRVKKPKFIAVIAAKAVLK